MTRDVVPILANPFNWRVRWPRPVRIPLFSLGLKVLGVACGHSGRLLTHRATQHCYSVAERCIPARCAALLQRWQLSLQRCKRYTKSCEVQRCGGSCTTLPNVIQRCAMLSHRCQTLSNVVQRCNKAVRCCIKAVQRFKLYNAAIVQRCATLPNVIQRTATL